MNFLVFLKKIYLKLRTKLGSQAIVSASLDVKLLQKRTGRHWPKLKQIWHIKKMMPKTEKLIFSISLFFFLLGLVWFGWLTILKHRQMIPAVGGIYTEANRECCAAIQELCRVCAS